jgi:hypothetical protein
MSETFYIQTFTIGPKDVPSEKRMTAEEVHEVIQDTLPTINYYDDTHTVVSIVCKSFFKATGLQFELEEINENMYKNGYMANCRDREDSALLQFVITRS